MVSFLLMGCFVDPATQIKTPKIKTQTKQTTHTEALYWVLRAQVHQAQGDWTEAEKALQEAKIYRPHDPWLYATWGDIAQRANQREVSIQQWKKAIQLFGMTEKEKKAELQAKINQD